MLDYGQCVVQLILYDTNLDFGLDATEFTKLVVTGWEPVCQNANDRIADTFSTLLNNDTDNNNLLLPRPAGQDDPWAMIVCDAIAELVAQCRVESSSSNSNSDANVFDRDDTNNTTLPEFNPDTESASTPSSTRDNNVNYSESNKTVSWVVWLGVAAAGVAILLLLGTVVVARRRGHSDSMTLMIEGGFVDAATLTSTSTKKDEHRALDDTLEEEEEDGVEESSSNSSLNHTASLYLAVSAASVTDDNSDVVSVIIDGRELEYYCTEDPTTSKPNNLEENETVDLEEPPVAQFERPDDEPVESESENDDDHDEESVNGRLPSLSHWMRDWLSLSSTSTASPEGSCITNDDDSYQYYPSHQSTGSGSTGAATHTDDTTLLLSNTTRDRPERRDRLSTPFRQVGKPPHQHHGGVPIRTTRLV